MCSVGYSFSFFTSVRGGVPNLPGHLGVGVSAMGAGRAKFLWASGDSASSDITLTAGPCGQSGESATGYIMFQTDTHSAICVGKSVCDDGLGHEETVAVIRIIGDQKAFRHIFGSLDFTGDEVYTTYLGAQYYSHTTVTQTDCDYPLVLSSPSASRIRVSASVGQCDPEYSNSKFSIIVTLYEVLSSGSGPNRYSLLSSVTGTITVKTNSSRDIDPISFKPDFRDGSSMAAIKEIARNYTENGGQEEWSMNYRWGFRDGVKTVRYGAGRGAV